MKEVRKLFAWWAGRFGALAGLKKVEVLRIMMLKGFAKGFVIRCAAGGIPLLEREEK